MTRREIEQAAQKMIEAGLMEEYTDEHGVKFWRLTEKGKEHADELDA